MSAATLIARLRVSPPVNRLRYHLYRDVTLAFPRRRACNICGWRGRRFLTYLHRHVLCPACGSHVRHRLVAAALAQAGAPVHLPGASILHFSPEYCLSLVLRPLAGAYLRADYATGDADIVCDITSMPQIASGRFDLVVACDVLEHVADDRAGLHEIRRVLRPGGTAILTVPQYDHDEPTLEDAAILSPEQRKDRYGQPDHVRNYGADFGDRLHAAGFEVRVVGSRDFPEAYVRRHVLAPPVPLTFPWGWNERRVYFARRPADA